MNKHVYANVSYWEGKTLCGFQAVIRTPETNRTKLILLIMDKLVGKQGENPVMDIFPATAEQVKEAHDGFCEYLDASVIN